MSIQAMMLKQYMRKRRLNAPKNIPIAVSGNGFEAMTSKFPRPKRLTTEAQQENQKIGAFLRSLLDD